MAFNLKAILRLDDNNFTSKMKTAERQVKTFRDANGRLRDEMGRYAGAASKASGATSNFGRGIGGALRGLGSLKTMLFGLVGAYAAVSAAQKTFNATVGVAMAREQSEVMISSMVQNEKVAKEYMKMMRDLAINSPVLDTQEMFNNSAGYLTISKDVKELEKLWKVTEKLIALNPQKNTGDAAFALRELMASGDAVSIIDQFNLDRTTMNKIKEIEDVDQQIQALDDYLIKLGVTSETIANAGDTALGKWQQVKEAFREKFLLDAGTPALEPLKEFFDNLIERMNGLDFAKYGEIGGKIISSILNGLTSGAVRLYDWFTALVNSDEFKEKTTLSSKVVFIIDNVLDKFKEWFKETGKEQLEAGAEELLKILAGGLILAQDTIVPAVKDIGIAIGKALVSGVEDELRKTFKEGYLDSWIGKMTPAGWGSQIGTKILEKIEKTPKRKKQKIPVDPSIGRGTEPIPGFNGGLNYVPYNGFTANLHKGESVLSRGEAESHRAGKSGGNTYQFGDIHLHGVAGDLKLQAKKLMAIIVDEIEASGEGGA